MPFTGDRIVAQLEVGYLDAGPSPIESPISRQPARALLPELSIFLQVPRVD